MIILQAINISKSFGIEPILTNINLQIQSKDRIGLVGANGAGKTTLLKILASNTLPDTGDIQIAKDVKIGYLAQNTGLESESTIWDEMITVFSHLQKKETLIRNLEKKMAMPNVIDNHEEYEKIMGKYATLTEEFKEEGGYAYEAQIRSILHGLGFQKYDYKNQNIDILSGGQKTRLALAKLLLEEPNLLILDEPTNYLDVDTLTWLESYLKAYSGAILVVSHDRYFLDTLVTTIYEIERTKATKYIGNYSKYLIQKEKSKEIAEKKYEKQQKEISKLEDFVQKNIARASTTKRAQSKRKTLEKLDRIDKPTLFDQKASFSFDTDIESGNNILMVKDLIMAFNNSPVFKNVSFEINKQERVALVGPNGVGKSTLFKLILKELTQHSGTIAYGSNVRLGYYRQEHDDLNWDKTIIDEIWDTYPSLIESEIRTTLGNFLFSGDDVFKKISDLSGGEKARVSLAKLMLQKANFLLLDEPTNHLDIYSREILEQAILHFSGTIFFISHDRYFLNKISTRTFELSVNGMIDYLGNYDYYIEKKTELAEMQQQKDLFESNNDNKNEYFEQRQKQKTERQMKRRIVALEEEIEEFESSIKELEAELLLPEIYSDHQLANKTNEQMNRNKEKLDELLLEWEALQEELGV